MWKWQIRVRPRAGGPGRPVTRLPVSPRDRMGKRRRSRDSRRRPRCGKTVTVTEVRYRNSPTASCNRCDSACACVRVCVGACVVSQRATSSVERPRFARLAENAPAREHFPVERPSHEDKKGGGGGIFFLACHDWFTASLYKQPRFQKLRGLRAIEAIRASFHTNI